MTIAQIQDALDTLIVATLPGYAKLSDSADVADNPNVYLNKGFATAFGNGERDATEFCNGLFIKRSFTLVLTNSYNANLDADRRQDLEQALMADHTALMLALEYDRTLSGTCVNAYYQSDQGIEYIVDDTYQKQYIGIITDITIQYSER
jgi:hypothetical protein